jgi:hypothetical protein
VNPLELYAVIAGLTAYALHKRKWGWVFFGCALLLWLVLMQIVIAYQLHGTVS